MIALTVPEARRLLVRVLWSRLPDVEDVLGWSEWRRAHQAFARRCHYKKRGAEPQARYNCSTSLRVFGL